MNRHDRRAADSQARKDHRRELKIQQRQATKEDERKRLEEQIRKILPELDDMAVQMGAAFQRFADAVKQLKFTTQEDLEAKLRAHLAAAKK